jgi:hypothetical protein
LNWAYGDAPLFQSACDGGCSGHDFTRRPA